MIFINSNKKVIREVVPVNRICAATFRLKNGDYITDSEAKIINVSLKGFRVASAVQSEDFDSVIVTFTDGDTRNIAFVADKLSLQKFVTDKNQFVYDCEFPNECISAKKFLKKRSRSKRKKMKKEDKP